MSETKSSSLRSRYGTYDASADNVNGEIAVRVTAAKFNGIEFDGRPFSAIPDWLREALEARRVILRPSGAALYVKWDVLTKHGVVYAEPGDWIIHHEFGGLSIVREEDAYILINLRPPVEGGQENNT